MKKPVITFASIQVGSIGDEFALVNNDLELGELLDYFGFTDKRYKSVVPVVKRSVDNNYGFAFVNIEDGEYTSVYLGVGSVPFVDKYLYEVKF